MSKFNFKTTFMAHGEKVVAGVFGLLGFLALGTASWSTDGRTSGDIEGFVDDAKSKIGQNAWLKRIRICSMTFPTLLRWQS